MTDYNYTKEEREQYYAEIKKFKDRGYNVIIIPHKAWEVLEKETRETQHYILADSDIVTIKIEDYYLFADVEYSYSNTKELLVATMAMAITKDTGNPLITSNMKDRALEIVSEKLKEIEEDKNGR